MGVGLACLAASRGADIASGAWLLVLVGWVVELVTHGCGSAGLLASSSKAVFTRE